jgi:hypothetical protein
MDLSSLPVEIKDNIYSEVVRSSTRSRRFTLEIRRGWLGHRTQIIEAACRMAIDLNDAMLADIESLLTSVDESELDILIRDEFRRRIVYVLLKFDPFVENKLLFGQQYTSWLWSAYTSCFVIQK